MKLVGKVAIVTGSSRGIGASIAHGFGAEGAQIGVVAHAQLDIARKVAKKIEAAGGTAKPFRADLSRVAECERLVDEVIDAFGTVDILVNNAGVLISMPIEDTTEEQWDAQIDLNLKGTYFMTKAVVPTMKAKGAGKIINVTSTFGFVGGQDCSIYCASKGGQLNLTRALCVELAPHGINVNSLAPGGVKTDMTTALRAQPGLKQRVDALTPAGDHFLNPRDLVGAAVFLASSDSDVVHGAKLVVDGGWTAW
jgi:NAD(P)-dependent dehydrogenase (short-subunit alcohol dehydrogenase family)